jgi:Zn-dependent peptidase ImmA (M78 family)
MNRLNRAVREARQVLAAQTIKRVPVDVERIAQKWAIVVRRTLDDDISGMLVPLPGAHAKRRWAIVVNETQAPVRQRFTVAHELGHLLLHGYDTAHADRDFRVRLRGVESSQGSVFEEIEANRFAAELLMPEELLLKKVRDRNLQYADDDTNDGELRKIADDFHVSKQALSIRLSTLLG